MTIRQFALGFLDHATAGPKGVRRGDWPYERVTEGRHTIASYSGCGDLGGALLFACGIRVPKFINRAENGSYVVGWNVVKLDALARSMRDFAKNPVTEEDIADLQPGDITIVWNRPDTRDAHVAAVRQLYLGDYGVLSIGTSDYGQGGAPHDGAQRVRAASGGMLGSRKLQRIIKLEEAVARYATVAPIPVADYFAVTGPLKRPTLRQGSSGDHVKDLQGLLNALRHELRQSLLKVDGDFGPKTDAAVEEFQRGTGLLADGVVGPLTWAELEKVHG